MSKRESLYSRYAYNDLRNNKGVNVALFVVLVLSALLMATGSMVMERMVGSVDQLFKEAKPPHFLQMHKGAYDPDALARFAAERSDIDQWLVEEMLGFDSAAISWHRPATDESGDLSDSLIDNLFVTQNQKFDFLIDETGKIPQPSQGEVYVPVAYQQQFGLRIGDALRLRTETGIQDLRVQGFVRDSQMASSMSSATRFLISETDFRELERTGAGVPEIIVEYLLTDVSATTDFQRAYESDGAVPKNGQAVTYQMIRIINAISDGLVAVALVFLSLLLISIALLNARFVIRGTLESQVREIGAMKAVGIPHKAIIRLYLAKFSAMTLLACLVGGGLAVVATGLLTRNVQANYAEAPVSIVTFLVPALALVLVYLFVIAICRRVLRRVRKIQIVNALVHGSILDDRRIARQAKRQARRIRRTSIASYRGGNLSRRLTFVDLRAEGRRWALVPIVFFLAAVLITLPMNLLSTFTSPQFVTYMGAPQSDLLVALQFSDDIDTVRGDLLASMRSDDRLTAVQVFASVLYEIHGEEGYETLRVEVGDYSGSTVEYVQGGPPRPGQIALSTLNADKYQVSTGDELTIRRSGKATVLVVSGVYQDVTSGGYTAKLQGEVTVGAAGYVVYADTAGDDADDAAIAAEYGSRFPTTSVIPMREYMRQTLSYVTDAFTRAAALSLGFGVGVAVLITSLFLKLQLTSERRKMGALSAIGFSTDEIIAQVRFKTLLTVGIGTALGLAFTATAGESIVGFLISLAGLGIARLEFIPNPWLVYLAYPLVLVTAGYLSAVALTARLRGTDKSSWLTG